MSFEKLREGDILLHHPFQTFELWCSFIREAAKDPDVLAIKQTLLPCQRQFPHHRGIGPGGGKRETGFRTGGVERPVLMKKINNIVWAKKLEKAGCHVIYGLVGLKTHSKITLVVRREEDGIRRYVHLGTGNYNDATAKLYTDIGMMTCSEAIGEDATAVFNMLSGYSEPLSWE